MASRAAPAKKRTNHLPVLEFDLDQKIPIPSGAPSPSSQSRTVKPGSNRDQQRRRRVELGSNAACCPCSFPHSSQRGWATTVDVPIQSPRADGQGRGPRPSSFVKESPGGEAGAFKETSHESRDQGALDAPILSQSTNQARRGSHKRPDRRGWLADGRDLPRRTGLGRVMTTDQRRACRVVRCIRRAPPKYPRCPERQRKPRDDRQCGNERLR